MKAKKPQARIVSIAVSRVFNTGNYTNQKLDLTAEVPPGASARNTLRALVRILSAANPNPPVAEHEVKHAESILSDPQAWHKNIKPERKRQAEIRKLVKGAKETMARFKKWRDRRLLALKAMDNLGGTTIHKDAKLDWEDDDYRNWEA